MIQIVNFVKQKFWNFGKKNNLVVDRIGQGKNAFSVVSILFWLFRARKINFPIIIIKTEILKKNNISRILKMQIESWNKNDALIWFKLSCSVKNFPWVAKSFREWSFESMKAKCYEGSQEFSNGMCETCQKNWLIQLWIASQKDNNSCINMFQWKSFQWILQAFILFNCVFHIFLA